ncbi:uncharacterized protein LOC135461761 [Liolophura sinensis]|uniref:uncharacterized protein LOC135461761 n=1 Tax=Liolophura sinensis TaxID=3198878 RepID=UPI0031582D60
MRTSRVTNFLSSDYTNKKMAIVSLTDEGGEHRWGKTIYDFANKKQYVISEDKCTVYPVTFKMTSPCIPASATYLGSSYLGGSSRISFDSWSYMLPEYMSNITISVSQDDCTPLVEEVKSQKGNFQSIMIGAFASFTLGIKDPNVFVPPPSCKEDNFKLAGVSVGHSAHSFQ